MIKMRKSRRGGIFLPVILLLFIGYELWSHVRVKPAAAVNTFAEFMEWRPESKNFHLLRLGDHEFILVEGPAVGLLPSCCSCYVFDERGAMVDWSYDYGDDFSFSEQWIDWEVLEEVSRERAEEVIK